jgi:hypothetical protein
MTTCSKSRCHREATATVIEHDHHSTWEACSGHAAWAERDGLDVIWNGDEVGRCELCSEPLLGERAEMGDPTALDKPSLIVHPDCGIAAGLEVA